MSLKRTRPKLSISSSVSSTPSPPPLPSFNFDTKPVMTIQGKTFEVEAKDLEKISHLGHGAFGIVEKMRHTKTNFVMAVKQIPFSYNCKEQKQILMDLDVSMRASDCPYTINSYGSLFKEGEVWICMEVMDTSLDKFYQINFRNHRGMPEFILGKISIAAVNALHYLHTQLQVIHRDVKPSNILINRKGEIKLCDFGISGYLVDSHRKTIDAGCKSYMAPERIDTDGKGETTYGIKSDVWSLGISLIEIATGEFPYARWSTPFSQIRQVVVEDSPKLPSGIFTDNFEEFVHSCLIKDVTLRADYKKLQEKKFFIEHSKKRTDVVKFVVETLALAEK